MIPNTYHPALLFPNILLTLNAIYWILISDTPSSNNDTHHYQSDNHQCCSDKIQRIHIYRFGKLIQPSLSCKVRYYNSHQDRWDSNI